MKGIFINQTTRCPESAPFRDNVLEGYRRGPPEVRLHDKVGRNQGLIRVLYKEKKIIKTEHTSTSN